MTEEEKKAIEDLKDILKYWQTIVEIEDDVEREIEMTCYSEEMPFEQLKIALNIIEKLQKENEEYKRLHINIQGMRNGKQLLTKYIKDSVPKDKIREKIKKIKENYSEFYECSIYKSIDFLKELLEED